MEENIANLLLACAIPTDNDSRLQSEGQIRQFKAEEPIQFLCLMVQQLNNPDLNPAGRHLAGVLFKNSVKAGEDTPFWFQLTPEQRDALKNDILAPLADPDQNVRLSACSCVATVACLELPQKEWQDIIPNLCTNSKHEDVNIKLSSLKTLGYICEELDHECLEEEGISHVISALIEALATNKDEEEIMKVSIEAVYHSLTFAENIFNNGKGGLIIEAIIGCHTYESPAVRTQTMMCIAEIVRLYYGCIADYMDAIKEATFLIMDKDEDEVKTLAIEVW